MNNFIFQIEKIEKEENIEIIEYSINNTTKDTIMSKTAIPYSIIIKKEDFKQLNIQTDKISLSKEVLKDKNNEKLIKIELKTQEIYKYIKKTLRELKIQTYEEDLIEEHRYLINNNNKNIYPIEETPPIPKILSIDIETLGEMNNLEVISVSIHSNFDNKLNQVIINSSKSIKKHDLPVNHKRNNNKDYNIIETDTEKELLQLFKKIILDSKPQIILGWNVIDFDFKVIKERMKLHNLEFKFSEFTEQPCKLRINNDFFKDSTMQCSGVIIIDAIQLLKLNFINFKDYKLDTVAKEVLNDNKEDISTKESKNLSLPNNTPKHKQLEKLYNNDIKKFIKYNYKDSKLTLEIIEKLKLIELTMKRSTITSTPISKIKSPIASLDIMYLKELHKQNIIANSNFNFNEPNGIEGAYVIEPKQGFYNNIFVYDFKSLYPSIIMTFNIDPLTFQENGEIIAPNDAKFIRKPGILPKLILNLYKQRDIAKNEDDKTKSFALKITMNSFYGALASSKSRFYNHDIATAITTFAQYIIKKAKKYIEDNGDNVIYGDTDSIFVQFNKKFTTNEEKIKYGEEITAKINTFFDEWVKTNYKQKSHLKIELEKIFDNFFIASKKRYVGHNILNNKTKFVGLEAVRGDWTKLAKNFQVELINKAFENKTQEEIKKFITQYIDKLNKQEFDKQLIYRKKLTKPLYEYTKTTPPHVKAAREIKDFQGQIVDYIITKNGPKHISKIDNNTQYDYQHYIEKQLKGVSNEILKELGIDFDDIVKNKNQTTLNKFF